MKVLLLLSVLLLPFFSVWAQTRVELSEAKTNKVLFGLKAGTNVSHMNFNRGYPTPIERVKTSWRPGLLVGGLIEVPLIKRFFIQPEYSYLYSGGKLDSTNLKFAFSYLSIPLLLKYKFTDKVAIVAGPQFDLLIKGVKTVDRSSTDVTHDTEERNINVALGIELHLIKKLFFNARYVHGLNNIGIGQRSDIVEFKYEMIQLAIDFKFGL